jgi:hypothetical protein
MRPCCVAPIRLKVKDGESRDSLSRLSGCIHTKRWCDVNRLLRHDASRVERRCWWWWWWYGARHSAEMCAQHAASFFEGGGGLLAGSANQRLKEPCVKGVAGELAGG